MVETEKEELHLQSEKSQLLDEVKPMFTPVESFGFRYLINVILLMIIALLILFPKVYFQNKIYYKSRDIAILQHEYDALKEENKIIKASVEKIRFKNQVLDTLF